MSFLNISDIDSHKIFLITTINTQLDSSKVKVSFLGNRVVELRSQGIQYDVSVDDLAEMIVKVSNPEMLPLLKCEQRLAAMEVEEKIYSMYTAELKGVTGILVKIRDIFCRFIYSTWWNRVRQTIEEDVKRMTTQSISDFTHYSSSDFSGDPIIKRAVGKFSADACIVKQQSGKNFSDLYIKVSPFKELVKMVQENRKLAEKIIKKSHLDRQVRNLCYRERFEEDPIKFLVDEMVKQGLSSSENDSAKIFIMSQIPDFGNIVTSKECLVSYVRRGSQHLDDHFQIMQDFNTSFDQEQGEGKLVKAKELFAEQKLDEVFQVLRELFTIFPRSCLEE